MQDIWEKVGEARDAFYMQQAIELSKNGMGFVNPNPLVGAVIVKDNRVVGKGWHEYFGGPHAEINAIRDARGNTEGATIYVTLEPCSHYGKTPPCSLAIIQNKFARVVVGSVDPNHLVAGKGINMIRNAGIKVQSGIMEKEVQELNEVFFKFIRTRLPFVVMKTAMSLDGKIATVTGDSQWISGETSRKQVHQLRNQYAAVMVGINTVLKDNPLLNVRDVQGKIKNPVRIVVDSRARIPLESKLLNTPETAETIVAVTNQAPKSKIKAIEKKGAIVHICPETGGRVDLLFLMKEIAAGDIDSILLEGGGTLNFEALKQGVVDKIVAFVAPKILGGTEAFTSVEGKGFAALQEAVQIENLKACPSGEDIMLTGYIKKK
ncbi:MAG: bifunctional diaminohydroxyphosphoribosylaminopyrimidine deaminase/5-amino-6-(5-phosphoribosylamino)uracil reductase RibD [Bacteroidales bacterium]|nr:bifunctional diaminohydroxyphosphoribosylaminopyrimidine deaminase/5-amino-6-(5-phosphoribosylamino)uracil reductase RibD [Bacteroidales bacterium]